MASLHQKRPSITNWFSSLRRQPRHKKHVPSGSFGSKQQLQRSCFDLSTQASTFYITPPPPTSAATTATATAAAGSAAAGANETVLSAAASSAASVDNLLDDNDRRRLVNNASDCSIGSGSGSDPLSQFCARCCCNIMGANAANARAKPLQPPATGPLPKKLNNVKARSPSLTPQISVATYNIAPIANIETPTTPQSPPATPIGNSGSTATITTTTTQSPTASTTLSEHTVRCADVSRHEQVKRLPCNEPNTALYQKRSEYTHTTTTTTTRTLIVSRPVELLLNEHGEIIERRPAAESKRKPRSNSVGCMLEHDDEDDDDNNIIDVDILAQQDAEGDAGDGLSRQQQPESPLSPLLASVIGVDDEFRFIDDSSNSQSESERNSVQRQLEPQAETKLASHSEGTNNNHNHNNNNNNNSHNNNNNNNNNDNHDNNNDKSNTNLNLCDVCRNVVARNCSNADTLSTYVILRRPKQIKDELCEVVSEMEALDVPEDCKHSNKEKQLSIGRKKFNMDPKKGIEYLVENRLLRHNAPDVAHFLYKGEGLNKTAIGDYLGEKNDFNEDVLKAFVALHDFTNLILVQALRQFLWSFRLPGEAQKIDRMMECFAQRYCQLNPDIFTNTDTCYVLSFAIIMLNTSLHNPSVKDKPTVEQFISMNRGINNGGDLPRGLLESLYESIRTEPFKIPQDDGNDLMHTFFNPDKEGWLWKQGGRYKSWKRRWFILNDNCLYYFEYTTDKEPRGIIPLENISVREIHDRSKPYCFELFATGGADIIKACKTDSEGKVVEGKHSVYRMSAATEEDQQEWIKRLTQSISHNPFYDILVQRKKKALSKS